MAAVHEALEDATRGMPDAAREAAAVGVLAAAGVAALRRHMRLGAAEALLALRCLDALVGWEGGGGGQVNFCRVGWWACCHSHPCLQPFPATEAVWEALPRACLCSLCCAGPCCRRPHP